MKRSLAALFLLGSGCATSPGDAESSREIVLQYVNADVGTAGPFSKRSMRELDELSEKDRADAAALLDRGAAAFLVFARNVNPGPRTAQSPPPAASTPTRIVLVLRGRVVGDFQAVSSQPRTP